MKTRLLFLAITGLLANSLFGEVVYSSIQSPLPPSMPSLGYQANQTAEFGNAIGLGGTDRSLASVSVVMTNWSYLSKYLPTNPTLANSTGFYVPLTLNLYNTGSGDAVGSLLTSKTENAFISWRPEPSAGCGDAYLVGTTCYNGQNDVISFDFSGDGVTLPDNLIYGLAFNTQTWGASPTGVDGPYDSLNFGLGGGSTPSVGTDLYPGDAYWNTSTAANYTDGGAGGVGTFRRDTAWTPYEGNIEISATPEPSTFLMLGGAMLGLGMMRRKATAGSK